MESEYSYVQDQAMCGDLIGCHMCIKPYGDENFILEVLSHENRIPWRRYETTVLGFPWRLAFSVGVPSWYTRSTLFCSLFLDYAATYFQKRHGFGLLSTLGFSSKKRSRISWRKRSRGPSNLAARYILVLRKFGVNSARAYSVEEKKVFLSKLELYEDERGIIVSSFTNIQMREGAVPSVIDIKKSHNSNFTRTRRRRKEARTPSTKII